MCDKLELLLNKINLTNDYICFFNNGCLSKIVGNKNKDSYHFYLELDNTLPLDVYISFIKNINKTFNEFKNIKVSISMNNKNEDYCLDYYKYFLKNSMEDSPIYQLFMTYDISYINSTIEIRVLNEAEKIRLDNLNEEIISDLENAGYLNIKINNIIDKEMSNKVKEEIDSKLNTNVVVKVVENPIIMGEEIKTKISTIDNIISEDNSVSIEAQIFGEIVYFESPKTPFKIITLKVTDYIDSMYCKIFSKDDDEYNRIKKALKSGKWYKIRGYVKNDQYSKELVLNARDINISNKVIEEREDKSYHKRVELHTHTKMSQMDGLCDEIALVKQAIKWKHRGIAITDHNSVQSFPTVYNFVRKHNKSLKEGEEPFKVIYGVELTLIDDTINITTRSTDEALNDTTFIVFDLETTGFNAGGGDTIIEIGAVKIKNGEIIDQFNELINPNKPLPKKITEITNITDDMLKDKDNEENAIKRFIEYFKDYPLVAHNAKFDISFIEMCYQKYNLGTFNNTVIDTLELSRTLDNTYARHGLSAIVKRYEVEFDEDGHHRADYDALATAKVFHKMIIKLNCRNFFTINDLNKLIKDDEVHKYGRGYHANILATSKKGLKNLFKIVSLMNTKYLYKTPRILRSEISKYREDLLIGSACYDSEVFIEAKSKSEEELSNVISFYDYIEVQPLDCYDHLLQTGDFGSKAELIEHINKIIRVTKEAGKLIVASGDVHHIEDKDKLYREIIVNQKVPGGGRHPLSRNNITSIPSNYFRTTDEMLENFRFLDQFLREEIVITNPNKILDLVGIYEVINDTGGKPYSPKMENSDKIVHDLVYGKAHELYGDNIHPYISDRIEQELTGIIKGGFDVIYLIAQKLVKKSNDDGYLVGSRGSVGSSFVATMLNITEVNPLPAHYRCPKCKKVLFEIDGKALAKDYSSGFDLPDLECDTCKVLMEKDGQDMPFATFLGFNADKVPDIDLNFSGVYQSKAHEYTKELFGVDNVYRAGTIGTVADKTAYGYVKGYCEDKNINMRQAEIERLALGCTGVKRTTGQHPGGIVVVPDYMDIFDFTPFQFPADDSNSLWRTTHFDYHAIEDNVLKLDILGHVDPTHLKMLQDLSGIDVTKVPLDDKDTMEIFCSTKTLNVKPEDIMCEVGTLGIPEFGTKFVLQMLLDTKPKSFGELIKISGLSHGTDVWIGNAQELIKNNIIEFKDVIGCRDDIMVNLMQKGLEPIKAFKIMEFVRKGMASRDPETWKGHVQTMQEAKIEDWFIDSCGKIKYMFPKAHAAAYVISAYRVAYFKVHYPLWYYASYFSVRCVDFDIETMIKGYDAIKRKIVEFNNKGKEVTKKEGDVIEVLKIALECTARGIKFTNIDIKRSDAFKFIICDETNELIPPFSSVDGLGDIAALKIIEEREKCEFLSIEDFQKRGKVSSTIIEKLRLMKVFDGMDESSQLSLF